MVSFDETLSRAFPRLENDDSWALITVLESEENYFFMLGQRSVIVGEDGEKTWITSRFPVICSP